MKKTKGETISGGLRSMMLMVFLQFLAGGVGAQPNLLGVWPVSFPLSYINWYDNNTYTIDTTGIWGNIYSHKDVTAVICNDTNQLVFQSNGVKLVNKLGVTVENGDSLVDAQFYGFAKYGESITQGVIALPRDANTWWVFNMSFSDSGWTNGTTYSPDRLYGAIIDISANGGAGKVTAKKIPVYKGIMGDCRLTACRHANGRDWWLVNHGWNNNVFNKWLVTPDSIYGPYLDSVGTLHKEPDIYGMAQFSSDGTKYAMGSGNGLVNILDFDRCSGEFSNLNTINDYPAPPYSSTNTSEVCGLCLSSSARFIYLSTLKYFTQYDLQASVIDSSRVVIAKYDTSYSNTDPFYAMALSPQNTILMSNFQGVVGSPYHLIQYPDSPGLACHFLKEAIVIPGGLNTFAMPNVVNLKLGKMVGSGCETLTDIRHQKIDNRQMQMQVFPNPANEIVYIESANTTQGELSIADELGRLLYTNPHFDGATAIKVNNWMNGIYFYRLRTSSNEQRSGKIVVQH